jgi:hypothetical protein
MVELGTLDQISTRLYEELHAIDAIHNKLDREARVRRAGCALENYHGT